MQTLTIECEVTADRTVSVRLPATVSTGRHRIALIIDPPEQRDLQGMLLPVSDADPARTDLWTRLSSIREQAERSGELPQALTWDQVLAEVQLHRGERDD
jgi:hypothetical protein